MKGYMYMEGYMKDLENQKAILKQTYQMKWESFSQTTSRIGFLETHVALKKYKIERLEKENEIEFSEVNKMIIRDLKKKQRSLRKDLKSLKESALTDLIYMEELKRNIRDLDAKIRETKKYVS